MTPAEHYQQAESDLEASEQAFRDNQDKSTIRLYLQSALVHATLATAVEAHRNGHEPQRMPARPAV